MGKRILVIVAHPNASSFCAALADRYILGAKKAEGDVQRLDLGQLQFDPILRFGFAKFQPLEKDLVEAQKKISWADHIVWVYPNWWGSVPSLLKGFIDRVFLPGFAFEYIEGKMLPKKLLIGKTSEILLTLDTPIFLYRFLMGAPGIGLMKSAVLGFCGVQVTGVQYYGPIRGSTDSQRKIWLDKAEKSAGL